MQELFGQGLTGDEEIHLAKVDNQSNRATATQSRFVIEPPAARDDNVVMLAPRAERRAFGPNLKAVMLQHLTKRNASNLVGKFRDFHLLIGHPRERRTSSNVLVTSSGEGQSDEAVGSWDSSFLGALGFGGGSSGVNPRAAWWAASSLWSWPALRGLPHFEAAIISIRSSAIRRSRMIFVVSDRALGGGGAAEDAFNGLVLEEVAGTFPL